MKYQNTHNPILPLEHHIPDAEAHVMPDGKLYLYGSYDACKKEYCSNYYRVAYTADLKEWSVTAHKTLEGTDIPWFRDDVAIELPVTPYALKMRAEMEQDSEKDYVGVKQKREMPAPLYAPDCAEKEGKYYLYFCMSDNSEGVAVSDYPAGPFLNPKRLPCEGIDPAVFVDEDGSAYYYWGQFSAKGVKLNPDMTSFKESQVHDGILTEEEHYFHEGFSMRKIGNLYYAVFADISYGKPTSLGYATAESPLGPFSYRGVIINNEGCDPSTWNNHGSIECFNGQWYVFYHRSSQNSNIHRRVCMEPIEILPDGTIPEVQMTSQGAGRPFQIGEWIAGYQACELSGSCYIQAEEELQTEYLGNFRREDTAIFRYVELPTEALKLKVNCIGKARVEVLLDGKSYGIWTTEEPEIVVNAGTANRAELKIRILEAENLRLYGMCFEKINR